MSVGPAVANAILTGWLAGGCRLSLHGSDPGKTGQFRLHGPVKVPAASFRISGAVALQAKLIELGTPERGGRARYVGYWTSGGQWITGVELSRAMTLVIGQAIEAPRGTLSLQIGSG